MGTDYKHPATRVPGERLIQVGTGFSEKATQFAVDLTMASIGGLKRVELAFSNFSERPGSLCRRDTIEYTDNHQSSYGYVLGVLESIEAEHVKNQTDLEGEL